MKPGGDFPLLKLVNEEQREEQIDAAGEHEAVAYKMHELNFAKVVENQTKEVKACGEHEHCKTSCGKRGVEIPCECKA